MIREQPIDAEFELLVRCCGVARGIPVWGPIAQSSLPVGFDEARFVDMAIQHKTAATAYAGLKMLGLRLEPEHASRLRRIAMKARLDRELIVREAGAIAEAAVRSGIEVAVLKGPASSKELYGDAYAREYIDLDILVNLPEIAPAIPFMAALGYAPEDYSPPAGDGIGENSLVQRGHHVVFWKASSPSRVEMHDRAGWERERYGRDSIDAVFARAVRLEESGYGFPAPCLADHAAIIIAHGTQHAWCLLHWVLDAAALCTRSAEPAESRAAAEIVQSLGMERLAALAYLVAAKLYDIGPPPAYAASAVFLRGVRRSAEFAFRRLLAGGRDSAQLRNIIGLQSAYAFPLLKTPREKAGSIFGLLKIPPKDIEAVPLPRPLFFVHLLLRPWFVMSRRWRRWKLARGIGNA